MPPDHRLSRPLATRSRVPRFLATTNNLIEETVEDYREGRLTRRQAMASLAGLTGALLSAELLAGCCRREPAPETAGSGTAAGSAAPAAPFTHGAITMPGGLHCVADASSLPVWCCRNKS